MVEGEPKPINPPDMFTALGERDFRTVESLATSMGRPEEEIRVSLENNPEQVRKLVVLNGQGQELFALRSKPSTLRERIGLIRMFIVKTPR